MDSLTIGEEALWKTQRIIELYRDGLEMEEIITYFVERHYRMSRETFYRLMRKAGGFTGEDQYLHYKHRLEKERNERL